MLLLKWSFETLTHTWASYRLSPWNNPPVKLLFSRSREWLFGTSTLNTFLLHASEILTSIWNTVHMIWKFQCTQTDKTRTLKVTVDILNFQRCTFPCSNVFFEFRMYSREENWFHHALSKSSAEENKSKGIPKTVWSQSWGCFLSVLASISLMQIMRVSHQHRLRKRFSSSGKCNYQRANRTTHHLCCQEIISQLYVAK